ncbi:glycoside hydrolase family 10 protein [Cylindrospermum sp. FACHB-282]|uniref:glycoside hydrolase family 10 protein n=1 Tax=Cylindrospermum sp. FACHB-282 TaxID=2692794 RepID=UPI001681E4DE|nr:family 10 glycosylhydrolase [Cylindrospermum sp. FACHB-282]MBD2387779.1 family 10 glycosylhydrolase [Cylindrospermum sp. FACHB-282]
MRNRENQPKNSKLNIKTAGLFILNFNFLVFNCLGVLPARAAAEEAVFSVVNSQENANQWNAIANRLQTVGVKYCVISLADVQSAADWGQRQVLFLPNVEKLTPVQAIALEEWMSKGGRLIASGPVGSLSAPGVRQLLRTILGGYWGFSLNGSQQLQPAKTKIQDWATQNGLFGKVRGGVVIPNDMTSQTAAVWNSQDHPVAVLTTERSTFLGWRWGTDAASTADLDSAWLKAALNRYLTLPLNGTNKKVAGGSQSCNNSVVTASKRPEIQSSSPTQNPAPTTAPKPLPKVKPPASQEVIDQLEQGVRLDVLPNSQQPIDRKEALALQQELENLIGRVESAHLAASAYAANISEMPQSLKEEQTHLAANKLGASAASREQVLAQSRVVAKNIPLLVAQKNYALARQQWLATKANLWKQLPINRRLASPEIRSVWLDRGTIVKAGSEEGLALVFDRLAKAGFNTVFFETINASYPIYPSQVAPQQNPLIKGWDPLEAGVKLAHERGMELHAWVWTFAAGNQGHNKIINVNPDYPGPVLAAHPDWANYDQNGKMIPVGQTKPFFDPANPELRSYLLKLYTEIVSRYQVDGLHLDYIRYPFQDPYAGRIYGYGKASREQFQQLTGVDPLTISPNDRDLWQKWTAFRTQQVDTFVAEVSQQLRQQRSNLILSVAVFPLPEIERIQKIQQHWEVWSRRGDIDLIVPMTYALDTSRFQRLAHPWSISTKLGSTLLMPGIRLLSLPTVGVFDQLQLVRDLPTSGYALFAAENLNDELDRLFSSTQGRGQRLTSEPIPHRQPFQSAAVRYAALQREWQFVWQNNQLQIPATTISNFNNQAEALQIALNQLAAQPSPSKLIAVRASLNRFQYEFRDWMRQQAVDNPYQVKAWENRLVTIERLLRYGERRLNFYP